MCWVFNLRQRGFVEVQLQPLNYVSEISSVETHNVFGYTRRPRAESEQGQIQKGLFSLNANVSPQASHGAVPVAGTHSFQHPHCRRGATLKALTDVIGVGPGPILKQHLSGLAGPGQRLEKVLHLISGATTEKQENKGIFRKTGITLKNEKKSSTSTKHKEIPAAQTQEP